MEKTRLKTMIIILIVLFIISWFIANIFSFLIQTESFGNVALIPIKGVITVEGDSSSFSASSGASSTEIVRFIKKADKDTSIKAIIFDINSPGGSAVASKEIMTAIKNTEKPTYAVIREVGASGGYWTASAADMIIADELSITGSIGVIASYVEFKGLLDRYNITYQRLTAGKYKDLGDPFKELEPDERMILLDKINKIHEYFIKSVAENRDMDIDKVRELATGEFYLGSEALESGLIDKIGNMDTAKDDIQKELNITKIELAEYRMPKSFLESLAGVFSDNFFMIGKGIGIGLRESDSIEKFSIST